MMKLKGNSVVWMYVVATWLWFGNSMTLGDSVPLVIRPVVPNSGMFVSDDIDFERIVRIVGANGLCVDVRDGRFVNGDPVQLFKCNPNPDVSQIWILKRDGTIRIQSHDKMCLTACSEFPGSYIMIYDCPPDETDATVWEVLNNGTIKSKYGLVLTAPSGESRTGLVLDANNNVPGQAWFHSIDIQPPSVVSIVGIIGFCLTYGPIRFVPYCNNTIADVWVEKCTSENVKQQWLLYPDGSTRPKQNTKTCLNGDVDVQGGIVRVVDCSVRSLGQRWMLKNEAIWNLHYGQVLDVKQSDPTLETIIIHPFNGNSNQKWEYRKI